MSMNLGKSWTLHLEREKMQHLGHSLALRAELCSLPCPLGSSPVFMEALIFLQAPCSLSTVYRRGHEETSCIFLNNFLVNWTINESVLQLRLGFCRNLCFYSKVVAVVYHFKNWCVKFPCWGKVLRSLVSYCRKKSGHLIMIYRL